MDFPKQLTAPQVMAIIANTTIGVSILALPRIASEKVNTGGFLVTFIGMFIAFIGVMIISYLSMRFPNETLVEYSAKLIGKPLSKLVGFAIIIYFSILVGLVVREFAEVMNHSLLEETPIFVTITSMLVVIAYTCRNSVTTFSHIHFYYFPFIVFPILLLVFFSFTKMEIVHLKPFLGNNGDISNFAKGTFTVIGLPFIQIGIFIVTILVPYMQEAKKIIKGSMWGMVVSSVTILFAVATTMAVFGAIELEKSLWPMFVLARMINFPADMLERIDLVFIVVWIFSAFTTLLSGYLLITLTSAKLFGANDHRAFTILLAPIVIGIALYPNNIHHLYALIEIIGKGGVFLTFVYPVLLLLLSIVRKKRGENN